MVLEMICVVLRLAGYVDGCGTNTHVWRDKDEHATPAWVRLMGRITQKERGRCTRHTGKEKKGKPGLVSSSFNGGRKGVWEE